jgi:hypothetical protein
MHFRFHIEDQSGGKAMDILIPKLLGEEATYNIYPYKGIGRLPKGMRPNTDASKRLLLDQLPRLLSGYGKNPSCGIIVFIFDLDDNDKRELEAKLYNILTSCDPKPTALFCFAIEEFEAWYLGDINAVQQAYPKVKMNVLSSYVNDSICGTWELLADATCEGGHNALLKRGRQAVGEQKSIWAKTISPHMNVDDNASPSFKDMRDQLFRIKLTEDKI